MSLLEKFRRLVHRGGPWWFRWSVRLFVVACLVACGFIEYDYEIGGKCRTVPMMQRAVRAQESGEVINVHVNQGDWLEAGQPIVTLAVRDERAAIEIATAELDEAKANLELLRAGSREEDIAIAEEEVELWSVRLDYAETEVARLEGLAAHQAADPEEIRLAAQERDSARQLFELAQQKLKRVEEGARDEEIRAAEAVVKRVEAELAHHQEMNNLGNVTAPIAGRVVTANIQERLGQSVKEGDLIAVLHDTSRLLVEVAADESAAAMIKAGAPVGLRLSGLDGRLLTGRVSGISWRIVDDAYFEVEAIRSDREALSEVIVQQEDASHILVYVDLDGTEQHLRPGMTGYARIFVRSDRLWRALARPILRFVRVDIWSWLP